MQGVLLNLLKLVAFKNILKKKSVCFIQTWKIFSEHFILRWKCLNLTQRKFRVKPNLYIEKLKYIFAYWVYVQIFEEVYNDLTIIVWFFLWVFFCQIWFIQVVLRQISLKFCFLIDLVSNHSVNFRYNLLVNFQV
jgi:hypothetical protein